VDIFKFVSKNRHTRFKDICEEFPHMSREDVKDYLDELVEAGLIKFHPPTYAGMEDFNYYFLAAEGYKAGRQLGFIAERESPAPAWFTAIACGAWVIAVIFNPHLNWRWDAFTIVLIIVFILASMALFSHYKSKWKEGKE
jgi:hypothetical protein